MHVLAGLMRENTTMAYSKFCAENSGEHKSYSQRAIFRFYTYGEMSDMKKLTVKELRNLIMEETRRVSSSQHKKPLATFLFEQDEEAAAVPEGLPAEFQDPQMTSFAGKDNLKDIDATEIVAQLASGNPDAPVFAAIASFHNPQFTPGIPKADTPEGVEAIAAWVLEKGPSFLRDNIVNVQGKLPAGGKPKDQMPALEPSDVDHVKDALAPGGALNIDLADPLADGEEDVEVWHAAQMKKDEVTEEAYDRLAVRLLEDKYPQKHKSGMPGAPVKGENEKVNVQDIKGLALSFLVKGLKDETEPDDSIEVKENEPIDVAAMIPTQSNVLVGKSLAFALGGGFDGQELGAYLTGGDEILDGHHRWSGTMIVDPGAKIKGHKVMAPASDIIPVLTSLGNALGRQQKGMDHEAKNESVRSAKVSDNLIMERWRSLAGLL
jgi:hypothetical protein